uniref:Uncharacterized protein n=1 Tax=Rhizophora mucronata TaxID=61149 RepID=A0A2P2QLJ6_RHIMU
MTRIGISTLYVQWVVLINHYSSH